MNSAAPRLMTEAQLRKRVKSACEGAQKAGLQVLGVEVGEGGAVRLITAPEGVDATYNPMPSLGPCGLDKWATNHVGSIEGRS